MIEKKICKKKSSLNAHQVLGSTKGILWQVGRWQITPFLSRPNHPKYRPWTMMVKKVVQLRAVFPFKKRSTPAADRADIYIRGGMGDLCARCDGKFPRQAQDRPSASSGTVILFRCPSGVEGSGFEGSVVKDLKQFIPQKNSVHGLQKKSQVVHGIISPAKRILCTACKKNRRSCTELFLQQKEFCVRLVKKCAGRTQNYFHAKRPSIILALNHSEWSSHVWLKNSKMSDGWRHV